MLTLHYRGALTARTAIAHGGDDRGIIHTFRHEHLILGGRPALVPIISGGAIRGSLRRTSAAMFQAALVGPEGRLPFPVVHALRTGGALTETRDHSEVLTGERQAMLRDLVPHFALFGVSGGGRIMSGRLHVGKALPVTAAYRLFAEEGLSVDVASGGELTMALTAGFDPAKTESSAKMSCPRFDRLGSFNPAIHVVLGGHAVTLGEEELHSLRLFASRIMAARLLGCAETSVSVLLLH